jgi:Flp pilus assembly protein TadG
MIRRAIRTIRRTARRFRADRRGNSTMEFALLTAVIAIPLYGVFRVLFAVLISHYQMATMLNGWPFP